MGFWFWFWFWFGLVCFGLVWFAFLPFSSYFFSKAEPALDEDGNPVVKKGRGRPPGSGNKKAAKKAAKTAKGVRRRLVLFHIMSSYLPASFNRNYQNLLSEWKRSWQTKKECRARGENDYDEFRNLQLMVNNNNDLLEASAESGGEEEENGGDEKEEEESEEGSE